MGSRTRNGYKCHIPIYVMSICHLMFLIFNGSRYTRAVLVSPFTIFSCIYHLCPCRHTNIHTVSQSIRAFCCVVNLVFRCEVGACAKGLKWLRASSILLQMRKFLQVRPNTIAFDSALSACGGRSGSWRRAMDVFTNLRLLHLELNQMSYNTAISAMEYRQHWETGLAFLEENMSANGLELINVSLDIDGQKTSYNYFSFQLKFT